MTTGWNYRLAWHDDICKGPVDAVLQFNGAQKTAWKGRRTASGMDFINKPQLWGGDKDQGGAVGPLRWMFGEAGQMPNYYLTGLFGPDQPARRGILTAVYEGGLWGANNPYQQKRAYRVERIKKGWDDDDCWYPETAPVPLDDYLLTTLITPNVDLDSMTSSLDGSDGGFDFELPANCILVIELGTGSDAWSFTPSDDYQPENYSYLTWSNRFGIANLTNPGTDGGTYWLERYATAAEARAAHATAKIEHNITQAGTYRLFLYDALVDDNRGTGSYKLSFKTSGTRFGMNPAHMILYAHSQEDTGGQPRASVDLDSFTAAADWFYARGFGLCTERKPQEESPDEFIQRIERIAGCSFSRSLVDGLYHLDIANGEYDLESLPIITDRDVLSFKEMPTVLQDAVNSVSVRYRDPERNEDVITPPTRAMALASQYGEIHLTLDYLEIPIGYMAVQVATRELLARATPTRLFELACRPAVYGLRRSQYVRLQLPKRGIADMVCIVGEISGGILSSGAISLKLNQDVYSLPSTVYTDVELGEDTSPPTEPAELAGRAVFEAPYITLAAQVPADELAAMNGDAGYVVAAAPDPGRMRDFTLATSATGGDFEVVDEGQFCPTAVLTGDIEPGLELAIGYTDGDRLSTVEVGDLVLIGNELCRVDAHDTDLQTFDLGRGCADTIPHKHFEGDRLYFFQRAAAFDPTQYIAGESIDVKILTNSWSERMELAEAPTDTVIMADRKDRPYPNGKMEINGESIFAVGTSTPGGGGTGGPGGGGPTTPPATSTNGSPASQELGPLGGYPDNGPPLFPLPTVFDVDVVDDPAFDDPDTLARWRKKDGTALGPEWSLVGGKLKFQGGFGIHEAYNFSRRFGMPYMPFPRLSIESNADVQNSPGTKTEIGVAWGIFTVGHFPSYIEASAPEHYPTESPVTHTWQHQIRRSGSGPQFPGEYPVRNFMQAVRHTVEYGFDTGTATVDNFEMVITLIDPPVIAETPTNYDLSAGLTGITLWPDPSDTNPFVPDISVAGGVLTATFHSEYGFYRWIIFDEPLEHADDADQFIRMRLKAWSNDAHTQATNAGKSYTSGGISAGIAYKDPGGEINTVSAAGIPGRGDFTPREYWHEGRIDASSGYTKHAAVLLVGKVGTQAKFKDLEIATTIDPYPDAPP